MVASGISILVSCCGIPALTAAQASPPSVHLLQTLLQSAFPELQQIGNRISITLEAGFSSDWMTFGICHFRLLLRDYKPPEVETVENQDDQFLAGHAMIADGYIEELWLHGLHVQSRENAALLKRAQDHPSWSDADLQKAIDDAGGLYGPGRKEAFIRETNIDGFREAFGAIQHYEVAFIWRASDVGLGSTDVIGVAWRVRLQTIDSTGRERCPALLFEPFRGKLTGLVEGRCGL